MRLSDDDLADYFKFWSDRDLREHWEASKQEAQTQFSTWGDRKTAQFAHACRMSAHRYEREMLRRVAEGSK